MKNHRDKEIQMTVDAINALPVDAETVTYHRLLGEDYCLCEADHLKQLAAAYEADKARLAITVEALEFVRNRLDLALEGKNLPFVQERVAEAISDITQAALKLNGGGERCPSIMPSKDFPVQCTLRAGHGGNKHGGGGCEWRRSAGEDTPTG